MDLEKSMAEIKVRKEASFAHCHIFLSVLENTVVYISAMMMQVVSKACK